MCHHYERESWVDDADAEPTADADAEDDDWLPEEFEEERATEVSLLTDGGDDA